MDAHVNEELVAGVEGPVATRAAGPEAGEILGPALVDVTALNVLDQLLLRLVGALAVDPAAMEDPDFLVIPNVVLFLLFLFGSALQPASPAVFRVRLLLVDGRELEGLVVLRRRRHERRLRHTVAIAAGADARRARRVDDPVAAAVAAAASESAGIESARVVVVVQGAGQVHHQVLLFELLVDELRRPQIGAIVVHEDVVQHAAQGIFDDGRTAAGGQRLLRWRPVKIQRRQFHR